MHKCELFSIKKSKEDFKTLSSRLGDLTAALSEQSISLSGETDVPADPKRLADKVMAALGGSDADMYIIANALSSADSSSFKKLFYELIERLESGLNAEGEHSGVKAKLKVFSMGDMGSGYKGYCFRFRGKTFIAVPCASLCGVDIVTLLKNAVKAAQGVISVKRLDYPDGVAYVPADMKPDEPKKKEGFFSSFIPHKRDSRASKIRKIVVLVAIVAFIGALVYVLDYFIFAPMQNAAISAEIQQIAYRQNTDETAEGGEELPEQDWDALKKVNKEIIGWIRMDGTPIDYPVLWHKQDDRYSQYYLKHNYKKNWDEYGAIFVDYRSTQGANSKNVILHGHNMLNGSMFHELMNYSDRFSPKLKYYKNHAVLTFNTPEGDSKWKVISVFKTSTMYEHGEFFNYMQGEFNSDAEFMNFVYNVRIRSMFNIPVTVNEDDQILTLSTCSYEFTNFRTVLVARKVRPGEDESVDVNLASVNSSPLYPDVYYSAYGGSRPDPLTFSKAYDKGLISWYDGKGDLEGSEELTATIAANPTEPPTDEDGNRASMPDVITFYQVIYRNLDGSQIAAYNVQEGDPVPVPDIIPYYEDDYFVYNFVEWDRDVPGVDFDHLNAGLEIYPIYDAVRK